MKSRPNTETRGVLIAAGLVLGGILLIVLPGLFGMDGMAGGYALGFIGVFVVLSGLITAWIFVPRATRLDAILSGRDLIAHWQYERAAVARQAARDRQQRSQENRGLFLIVAAWMLIITVLLATIGYLSGEGDNMAAFVAAMLGVLAVVAAAAFGMPYLMARQALRSSHEAYIGSEGLYLNGTFHAWNPPWSRKSTVQLIREADGTWLVFHLRNLTGPGWLHYVPYTVEVPVPSGAEEQAEEVVRRLAG